MKKVVCIIITVLLCVSMFAACAPSAQKEPAPSKSNDTAPSKSDGTVSDTDNPYKDVEPLSEPIEITFGILNGSPHGVISVLIEKMGGFEQVGIKPKWQVFGNGPVMVEALASDGWDCGTYGIGGTLSGAIGQGAIHIGASNRDFDSLQFFTPKDSDIVKAGKNISTSPELYGTADTWRGKEIYVPTGTTLHYALAVGLEKFGLTDADVKLTHMDVTNVNTAMRAGKGEVGGLWGNFTYAADLDDKFARVMKASDTGVELVTTMAANPRSYNDPKKREAIKKWAELYFKTVDWVFEQNNLDKASEMFYEWDEEVGVKATPAECKALLVNNENYTLKENYLMFTQKSSNGKMTIQEELNYKPLEFFIAKGKYKPEDGEKFLNGSFNGDIVKELYEASQKK
ncbi:hypothetical protein [Petroclostridium sp. X23]|uniref:ABC transporter substrate-binding protein n=1 Tax=Petroclostridium sp. X23 TaxID=3045146 RepID=UPI0024AD3217|nr:hypothetical protein [Petroclostridium sp. X23]WHH56845.1 hypothetical protein QKW49_13350 [Petroclostridium sp. X23]